ncbi:hypothetical protein SAMN05216390_10412 [Lachnospiraceae bacterium KH1T2]|nr:hypothetical protein SAMN05216390_10412 [Lachnospiraceae bacterium KH1T2]
MSKDIILNVAIIIMEVIGLTMEFITGNQFFVYYTVDSNIIALLSAVVYLICRNQNSRFAVILRYVATCALSLTMLIVFLVLMPTHIKSGTALSYIVGWDSTFVHVLCPVASFISFMFYEKNDLLKSEDVRFPVGYTIIYGVIIVMLNIVGKVYGPYNFLRIYDQPVWMSIFWTVFIFGIAIFIARMIQSKAAK